MTDKSSSFSALFGSSRESANLVGIAVNAVRSGFAVIPIKPGDKKPMCTLTETQRKSADKKQRNEAKAAGRRDWKDVRHSCGVHEAIDTESRANSVFKRLLAEHPDLNLAIEVGRSRVLVVDADTAEEVDGFTQHWGDQAQAALLDQGIPNEIAAAAGEQIRRVLPTVISPGKISDDSGEWVHKNGGHFYFRLPEGVDFSSAPAARGLKLPGGAMAYVKDRAILVPPSVRPEGAYVLGSDISDAPEWLVSAVTETVTDFYARKAMQAEKIKDADDPITVWSSSTPWRDLLEPAGWGETFRFESCGCPSWLRPGDPASDKSAVAHEDGCTRFDDLDGGFLHLWSDNAYPDYRDRRGTRNMTKLDFVTYEEHGRVDEETTKATKSLLGLYRQQSDEVSLSDIMGEAAASTSSTSKTSVKEERPALTLVKDEDVGEVVEDLSVDDILGVTDDDDDDEGDDDLDPVDSWLPASAESIEFMLSGAYEPPKASLLLREDGQGLLYPGRVHWMQGEPESGKSWVAQQAAAESLKNAQDVLYIDYEQDLYTIVTRLRLLGVSAEMMKKHLDYVNPSTGMKAIRRRDKVRAAALFMELLKNSYCVAVVDGVTDALGNENFDMLDNKSVAEWMREIPRQIARRTGAAVICVDHVTKDKEGRGRYALGAQAKLASVDGCTYIIEPEKMMAPGKCGILGIRVLKDRYGDVRSHSGKWQKEDRSQPTARITFDGEQSPDRLLCTISAPVQASDDPEQLSTLQREIVEVLREAGEMTTKQLLDGTKAGNDRTLKAALEELLEAGLLSNRWGVKNGGKACFWDLKISTDDLVG